jgi:hypothetical protein
MSRIMLAAFTGLLITAPSSTLSGQQLVGREDSTAVWRGNVPDGQSLYVKTFTGSITVRASSGDALEIRAEKRTRGTRLGIRDIAFDVRETASGVRFCTVVREDNACEEGHSSNVRSSVSLVVTLPRGVTLRAHTGNGDIVIEGTGADVDATTGNGKVRVSGATGRVRVVSGNGDLDVRDVGGPVRASTGNGRVFVSTAQGPVSASTLNGDIDVRMASIAVAEAMTFTTGSGTVRLTLPSDFSGDIDAGTVTGSLVSEFPIQLRGRVDATHVRGRIGNGGPVLRLRSGNGKLELRKG